MATTRLRLTGAGNPRTLALVTRRAAQATKADLLEVLALQQARILARTERGVDFTGKPFAAYSKKGPYYFYPAGPVGRKRSPAQARSAQARITRLVRGARTSGTRTASGLGLKFASYGAFKRSYLGRSTVDLRGARAPHMLQQIVLQTQTNTHGTLGIYGEAGARAAGHNDGARHLPQRRFFDASDKDIRDATELLADRVVARILAAHTGR